MAEARAEPVNEGLPATLRGPDFFIVGAPKSGTTTLHGWLGANPDVFLAPGEPHYFSPAHQQPEGPRAWTDYLAAFEGAQGVRRLGEKAVWYLSSDVASARIAEYRPSAQIIIILRNPVDAMHSLHGYNLFYGEEDIEDFFDALSAEPDRRAGRRIPDSSWMPWNLRYREAFHYAPQVERYLSIFGGDRVRVVLFDDLEADPEQVYAGLTRFLGVSAESPASFAAFNANKVPRSQALQQILYGSRAAWLRRVGRVVSRPGRRWVHGQLARANARESPKPELDPAKRRQLEIDLAPEVEALAALIDRDLSSWTSDSS